MIVLCEARNCQAAQHFCGPVLLAARLAAGSCMLTDWLVDKGSVTTRHNS
jgi:hypothetical protein